MLDRQPAALPPGLILPRKKEEIKFGRAYCSLQRTMLSSRARASSSFTFHLTRKAIFVAREISAFVKLTQKMQTA